ncbi:MAG: hypothetical protein KC657_34085 [Myxococcales bacterium]|nr:hypothetical protein [Myxococcales bacterium]
MASSWTIYASATTDAALRAVDAMYAALEELYEKVDLGDGDSAPDLGFLPDVEVSRSPVPKADAERAAVAESAKIGARVEDAAFARLSKCKSTLIVDRPTELDEDPTLVSALKILFEMLGPSVFVGGDAHRLVTSETLLAELAKHRDLDAAIKARGGKPEKKASAVRPTAAKVALADDSDTALDSDTDLDASDTELDSDTDLDDEDDEEAADSAEPDALRRTLAAIAEHPASRRRAGDLLEKAPDLVQRVAERLARIGVESDDALARGTDADIKRVKTARLALAALLRKAARQD